MIKFFHERYFCNREYDSTGEMLERKKKKIRSRKKIEKVKEKLKGTNELSCSH